MVRAGDVLRTVRLDSMYFPWFVQCTRRRVVGFHVSHTSRSLCPLGATSTEAWFLAGRCSDFLDLTVLTPKCFWHPMLCFHALCQPWLEVLGRALPGKTATCVRHTFHDLRSTHAPRLVEKCSPLFGPRPFPSERLGLASGRQMCNCC